MNTKGTFLESCRHRGWYVPAVFYKSQMLKRFLQKDTAVHLCSYLLRQASSVLASLFSWCMLGPETSFKMMRWDRFLVHGQEDGGERRQGGTKCEMRRASRLSPTAFPCFPFSFVSPTSPVSLCVCVWAQHMGELHTFQHSIHLVH